MSDQELIHDLSTRLASASDVLSRLAERDGAVKLALKYRGFVERLRAELEDCKKFLNLYYAESQADFETPPEPADKMSYDMVPVFVGIYQALKDTVL